MSTRMNPDFKAEKEKRTKVLCKLVFSSLFSCVGCYHCQLRVTDQIPAQLPIILLALKLTFQNILLCHWNDCFVSWLWFSLKVYSFIKAVILYFGWVCIAFAFPSQHKFKQIVAALTQLRWPQLIHNHISDLLCEGPISSNLRQQLKIHDILIIISTHTNSSIEWPIE